MSKNNRGQYVNGPPTDKPAFSPIGKKKRALKLCVSTLFWWLRGQDLNLRPPGYENLTVQRKLSRFVCSDAFPFQVLRCLLCQLYKIVPYVVNRAFAFWGQFWGQINKLWAPLIKYILKLSDVVFMLSQIKCPSSSLQHIANMLLDSLLI